MVNKKIIRSGFMTEIDKFLRQYNKNRKEIPPSVREEYEKYQKLNLMRDQAIDEVVNPILKDL